jgi:hypothetical protein
VSRSPARASQSPTGSGVPRAPGLRSDQILIRCKVERVTIPQTRGTPVPPLVSATAVPMTTPKRGGVLDQLNV